ncbi:MAG: CHASE3 domain-containing protein, partial [Alphaproteobacteria bacterium]|nr:CHASE3 domain-containing protein [Alphaproteobacteria bacterium]
MSANRLVLLAAVPLFLVLAGVAFLTVRFAAGEREAQADVTHTYQVIASQQRLQDDVQTAETALRGFLLSHDPAFEAGYQQYLRRIPADLKAFRDLTADNPAQQRRAGRLSEML